MNSEPSTPYQSGPDDDATHDAPTMKSRRQRSPGPSNNGHDDTALSRPVSGTIYANGNQGFLRQSVQISIFPSLVSRSSHTEQIVASITKCGRRWLVQIRRKGEPAQSRTFASQADARAWAIGEEARIDRAEPTTPRRLLAATSLRQLIDRYLLEITPHKRSAQTEALRLRQLSRDPLAARDLASLTSSDVADFRDRRLESVRNGTVRRDLALLSHVFEVARKEWGFRLSSNPVRDIRQPPLDSGRERRLEDGAYESLMHAIAESRNRLLKPIVQFAIETGTRRGEIVALTWSCVDLRRRTVHMPVTKTGKPRSIPITNGGHVVPTGMLQERSESDKVFEISPNALKLSWQRAVKRSGLDDLHFHDLRHEAISHFFEFGLSLVEVAVISGHRDHRKVFQYTHLRPDALADKLRGLTWTSGPHSALI